MATYQALCERIDGFASRRPDVAGVSLLRQRACRDLKFVQGLDGVAGVELRSAANNAVGMNAELDVVRARPASLHAPLPQHWRGVSGGRVRCWVGRCPRRCTMLRCRARARQAVLGAPG